MKKTEDFKKVCIRFSPPDMTKKEAEAVFEAVCSEWITTGPKTKEFEEKIAK